MIETIITTQKKSVEISVAIPDNYVGKQLHVLIYADDESPTAKSLVKPKPSDFFGTLSLEQGQKFHDYVQKSRSEWDRNF